MNKQHNTTETFSTGTNNFPVNHRIFQTVLGAAQITCVAVVLMFVVSACGSSDELSESPAVAMYENLERTPTTTIYNPWAGYSAPDLWEQPVYGFMQDMQERFYPERLPFPDWFERRHQAVEAWELKLPELARHAKSHPGWIDVERIVPLIEMHGNADPRFKDAKKADGFVHLLSIRDISLDQAGALLDEVMVKWRVVQRDCQYLAVTEDWRPGRVNLSVIDDLVVGWQVEGAGHAHGSTWCASNASDTDPVHGILGLDLSEAAAILDAKEVSWRLVGSECPFQPIAMTLDLVEGRLNLETMNGVVVYYSIEHMDGPDNVYKMEPQSICPDTPEN